jgi:hypothetical protein
LSTTVTIKKKTSSTMLNLYHMTHTNDRTGSTRKMTMKEIIVLLMQIFVNLKIVVLWTE